MTQSFKPWTNHFSSSALDHNLVMILTIIASLHQLTLTITIIETAWTYDLFHHAIHPKTHRYGRRGADLRWTVLVQKRQELNALESVESEEAPRFARAAARTIEWWMWMCRIRWLIRLNDKHPNVMVIVDVYPPSCWLMFCNFFNALAILIQLWKVDKWMVFRWIQGCSSGTQLLLGKSTDGTEEDAMYAAVSVSLCLDIAHKWMVDGCWWKILVDDD